MKILLLVASLLALMVLGGCTKTPDAAPAITPPEGVSQSNAQPGAAQVQQRPSGAASNQ